MARLGVPRSAISSPSPISPLGSSRRSPLMASPSEGGEEGRRAELSDRDWSGLPEPALFSVAMSLTGSLADVLAFGGVCRAWRSVAKGNEGVFMSSLPPFLFFRDSAPDSEFYCPADGRWYENRRLTALLKEEGSVVGGSFGHLVMCHVDADAGEGSFSVVNPLAVTRVCQFPRYSGGFPAWALLSSHPASPECVLWSSDGCRVYFCGVGDQKWTTSSFGPDSCTSPPVFLRDKGYLHYYGALAAFDINPRCSSESTLLPVGGLLTLPRWTEMRLCVSDAELLQIRLLRSQRCRYRRYRRIEGFDVYRFDFAVAQWVRLHGLGHRAVLWDAYGRATMSDKPGRWGGCGNCVYFVDRAVDATLSVFHLDDGTTERLAWGSRATNPRFWSQFPVWIHPSMRY